MEPKAKEKPRKRFLVRASIEYSIEVEAESEEKALAIANAKPFEDWDQSSASYEAEEQE